jgi:hypothetical protein
MIAELQHWNEFYVLIGTAGATLLGLLFVAVSLGTGFLTSDHAAPTRAFYSPVVIHFTSVFFVSAIALFPAHRTIFFTSLIGATALIGTLVSVVVTIQLVSRSWTEYLQDYLAYGLLPAIAYVALAAAALMIFKEMDYALDVLAAALLLLLIVNIRNVWDLMLSMVRRQAESTKRKR